MIDPMNEKVFVAMISLHYEERPTIIHEWSRERYAHEKANRKDENWYYKRVTVDRADEIWNKNERAKARKQYDQAIMKKYGVGANYRNNRWFMEQVRPTL